MNNFYSTRSLRLVPFLLLLFGLCSSPKTFAQSTVQGTVTDEATGEALPGVNIVIKGTTQGTSTDVNGKFSLKANAEDVLVFSYIGYESIERKVGTETTFNIQLPLDQETLDEVIVVGYGTTSEKLVTTSIASIKAEDLQNFSAGSVENAISGRIAGVTVVPSGGSPGAGIKVRVRGTGSNGNSNPLYIVDGMRVPNLDFLDPMEIGSLDVLKDAAAAAIYGAEGANGVVIVSTKSGVAGKPTITYDFQYGVQSFNSGISLMNLTQYDDYWSEKGLTRATPTGFETNWLDEIFQSAPQQRHALTISGGNEKSTYLVSGNYFNQDGVIGGDLAKFERASIRFNANHNVKDWLTFSHNTSYANFKRRSVDENNSFGGIAQSALLFDPGAPVTFGSSLPNYILTDAGFGPDQNYQRDSNGNFYGVSNFTNGEIANPVAELNSVNNQGTTDLFINSFKLTVEPIKGLKVNSRLGVAMLANTFHSWTRSYYYNSTNQNASANSSSNVSRNINMQWENWINYGKSFGDHDLDFVLGTSIYSTKFTIVGGNGGPLFGESDELSYLSGVPNSLQNTNAFGNEVETRLQSFYGRAQYNYKDRYLFGLTVRTDGSSLLSEGNQWGIFPSVSAGWVISNEDFFNESFINYAKVRASWGRNGSLSNLFPGAAIGLVSAVFQYTDGENQQLVGAEPTSLTNNELTWETSDQINIGFDLGLLDDKVSFSFDYFVKETRDLLNTGTPPGFVGNFAPIVNSGTIQNKGIELAIGYENKSGALTYSVSGNLTAIKNEVTEIDPNKIRENGTNIGVSWPVATAMEEGLPIWYFRGYETNGIFQNQAEIDSYTASISGYTPAPGDPVIVDVNGDNQITPEDYTQLGSPHPDFVFGFNANLAYKGFDFKTFIQGSVGNDVIIGYVRDDLQGANYPDFFYTDRWTTENPTNDWFRADANGLAYASDFLVRDASFVKIRQIQVGYTLPASVLGDKISSARFYISLDNFFTFSGYRGFDPEIGGSNSDNSLGIDRGVYPTPRVFLTGLTLRF